MNDHEAILEEIKAEIERQREKWGTQHHDPYEWLAILTEEVGETAEAILHDDGEEYLRELIQVAAVAVSAIECYHRRYDEQKKYLQQNPTAQCLREQFAWEKGDGKE